MYFGPQMKRSIFWYKWELIRALNRIGFDRSVLFNDLSQFRPTARENKSEVLNFYSAANNIGNYLPVIAIHRKLGGNIDCWNVHDDHIDYEYINKTYKSIVVGGAGLFHPVFNRFWDDFSEKCTLPFIIWGVGGCFPDNMNSSPNLKKLGGNFFCDGMTRALRNAELVNVRDYITADIIARDDVSVTACPTLMLLKNYGASKVRNISYNVTYAPHFGLISKEDDTKIKNALTEKFGPVYFTENKQSMRFGLWDVIEKYKASDLVVTSRLHGAIIAWSLGVPFLALSRDKKLDGFAKLAGLEDIVFRDVDELLSNLEKVKVLTNDKYYKDTVDFSDTAHNWVKQCF